MPDPLSGFTFSAPYPYPTGYGQLSDVTSRVMAGTWDPANDPTASPTVAMVNAWLVDAAASIDAALATRGYTVPLVAVPGWVPPAGMQVYQGVGIQAWLILRSIAADYAAFRVELARHGGSGPADEDDNASTFAAAHDDWLTRLESGADNLTAFGVNGPFVPEIDPAKSLVTGGMGMMLANPSRQEGPLFTKYGQLGGGWETGSLDDQLTSGPPFSGA
jgi:hypothetical protein